MPLVKMASCCPPRRSTRNSNRPLPIAPAVPKSLTPCCGLRRSKRNASSNGLEEAGLTGLKNIGNSCFMNAVVQCLSHSKPLLEYLLDVENASKNESDSIKKGALIEALGEVINKMWKKHKVVDLKVLKTAIENSMAQFQGNDQHDPQEFLRCLLEGINKDLFRTTPRPTYVVTYRATERMQHSTSMRAYSAWYRYLMLEGSEIAEMFGGQLRSSLKCTVCQSVSTSHEVFWDISLPVPEVHSGKEMVKLSQCFDLYTKEEMLEGVNCSNCNCRRTCKKRLQIEIFPPILVVHINRLALTGQTPRKVHTFVEYPIYGLDISRCAPRGSLARSYNLFGVAHHTGTAEEGHYFADCKHPYTGEWHRYNDSKVTSVNANDAVSPNGYILFYKAEHLTTFV